VAQLLGTRTGLNFSTHRQDSVEQGICRAMNRAGATDPTRYHDLLAPMRQPSTTSSSS